MAAQEALGYLNIAKAAGMTSHDVVARIRRLTRIKQIGHGGTLDPMATGVLPVAVGKACRLLRFLENDKVYVAQILLGMSTTTDDIEGEAISRCQLLPDAAVATKELAAFVGNLQQLPPAYSAIKVDGRRLHELARAGQTPELIAPRAVTVYAIDVLSVEMPVVTARIACASGTYIRSIARDLGANLGCGGCLQALVREKSGRFTLDNAISLDTLTELAAGGHWQDALLPAQDVLPFPRLGIDENQMRKLKCGQALSFPGQSPGPYLLADCNNTLIAVCSTQSEPDCSTHTVRPEVVIT